MNRPKGSDSSREVSSAGQILSSVMNAPGTSTQGSWTALWPYSNEATQVEAISPYLLPLQPFDVSIEDFQSYLARLGSRYEHFVNIHEALGTTIVPALHFEKQNTQSNNTKSAVGQGLVQAMREVPSEYFDPDFSLTNPDDFERVCPSGSESSRLETLEKLTHYLDVVEMNLTQEISSRFSSFFEAAKEIQELSSMIQYFCNQVNELRTGVKNIETNLVLKQKEAALYLRRQKNLHCVLETLEDISSLSKSRATLDLLLSSSDYGGALDILEDIQAQLRKAKFSELPCFKEMSKNLERRMSEINNMISEDFFFMIHNYLVEMPEGPVEGTSNSQQRQEELRESLVPLVIGLLRTGRLAKILAKYSDMVLAELRRIVETKLDQILVNVSELGQEEAQPVAEGKGETLQKKALDVQATSFLSLLDELMELVTSRLQRVTEVAETILAVMNRSEVKERVYSSRSKSKKISRKTSLESFQEEAIQSCNNLTQTTADSIQRIWVDIYEISGELVCQFDLDTFVKTIERASQLWEKVEILGAKQVPALRSCVTELCCSYLQKAHARCLEKVKLVLDQDQWEVVEVPAQFQCSADSLFDQIGINLPDQPTTFATTPASRAIRINGREYLVTASFLILLEILARYRSMLRQFPAQALEIARHFLELCKLYNSRTCQLVLGAKAMETAVLKSITAKHLGAACASITALATIFPQLREEFQSMIPQNRQGLLSTEMDRLHIELQVHKKEVLTKLITIMQNQLESQLERLASIVDQLEKSPQRVPPKPSPMAKKVKKQLQTLQNVLSPLLLEEDLDLVFGQVGAMYAERLAQAYTAQTARGPRIAEQLACDAREILPELDSLLIRRVQGGTPREGAIAALGAFLETK